MAVDEEALLRLELDTYQVLDRRKELRGNLTASVNEAAGRLRDRATQVWLVASTLAGDDRWRAAVPLAEPAAQGSVPVVVPVGTMPGGYYRLVVAPGTDAAPDPNAAPYAEVTFCIAELWDAAAAAGDQGKGRYLCFVADTVETLLRRQSARLGGALEGTLFLTVTRPIHRGYRSLGHVTPEGRRQTYWFPEAPMTLEPFLVDLELWPILERLSDLTGASSYREHVEEMAAAFARHGFDPRSGLGYLGEEASLDVLRARPTSIKSASSTPYFKPKNTGTFPGLPLGTLWAKAPDQLHRMFRSMFYGLVTDPESMDFNRFWGYDYSDAEGRHAQRRNSGHCAFESVAGRMIHWWAFCFARTGDPDCLEWAERMAAKWQAVQHPESGLVPNFFGAVAPQEGVPMPPGEWAEVRGTALMAVALLDAAAELRRRAGGGPLSGRLVEMAVRMAAGVGRHSYDPERRVFREHLHLDGRPYRATARYTFHTQEEKDAAVRLDPLMAQVAVYDGTGVFRNPGYWEHCAGSAIPGHLAAVAAATGDRELLGLLGPIAADIVEEARRQPRAITPEGAWTFRATGDYLRTLVLLSRATGEGRYLEWAAELADRELACLARVACPDWWRMPERAALLNGLLVLYEALE